MNSTGLLLGYGSIGRRHAEVLAALCSRLVVVDVTPSARERAQAAHPACRTADALAALDAEPFPWADTVAVIATWGPSHAQLFHQLADRGVRSILCEKPLAASVADAAGMVERAAAEGIALGVNHFVRYTGIVPALKRFAAEHQLGEPVAVVGDGGAACLVTNGLHWIDFATELFEAPPTAVISTAAGQAINPRAPDLLMVGGTAAWSFGNAREAVLSFTNRSSIALGTRVYFRNAVADIDNDASEVQITGRDPDAVAQYPAVTRCGPASETLFSGTLPGMRLGRDRMEAAIREVAAGAPRTAPGAVGLAAVSASIGALVAARERVAVPLPLEPESEWGREQWRVS